MNIKHKIDIEVQTPVAINSGEKLSPLSDFLIIEDELYYIDHNKFEAKLTELDVVDDYMMAISKVTNKSKQYFLNGFLKRHDIDVEDVTKFSVPYNSDSNPVELSEIIKSAGRPYIPGSTIKGAIRTAIIYDWLINCEEGKGAVDKIFNILTQNDNRKANESIKDIYKKDIEKPLFGDMKSKTEPMELSMFQVSDSNLLSKEAIEVYDLERVNIRNGESGIHQLNESIKPKTKTSFSITINPCFNNKYFDYLKNGDLEELFRIINQFTLANTNYDIDAIYYNPISELYDNWYELFKDLNLYVNEENKGNTNVKGVLRIGSGKNYFYNSIGLAIYKKNPNVFNDYLKTFRLGKPNQVKFPVTRTIISNNSEQAGWIILERDIISKKELFFDNKQKQYLPFSITSFEIKDYKGIIHTKIENLEYDAQWMFLTGENGYGKTAVLQALALALAGNDIAKKYYYNKMSIELKISKSGTNLPFNLIRSKQDSFQFFVVYGPSRLNIERRDYLDKNEKIKNIFSTNTSLISFEDYLIKWFLDTNEKSRFKVFRDLLIKLLPNIENITIKSDKGDYFVCYHEKIGIKSHENLNFHRLASGLRSIISLVGDMCVRLLKEHPNAQTPEELSGIVIIDELDLHLHPKWLKKLPKLLSESFPLIQFIASTHSIVPFMGAPVNSICLHVTRDSEKGIEIERLDVDFKELLPNTLLSSGLFDLQDIIHENQKDFRTETYYSDILDNKENDKKLKELLNKYNLNQD